MPETGVPGPLVQRIHSIRGARVMLDADLAELYGVATKRFNEQVKRNLGRFPVDFMFQLTAAELASLRSQIATSNASRSQTATTSPSRGGRRHLPYAFTEHGAIMAATILNSPPNWPNWSASCPRTIRPWLASSTPSAN